MSIVKIHLYRSPTEKQQKFLLTYLPQIHSTISQFLQFAIKALDIQHCTKDDLMIENQGYILPHCLDGIVIKQMNLLTIKVKNIKKLPNFWTAQKLDEQLLQASRPLQNNENHIEVESSQSQQSTPKFSQHGTPKPSIVKKDSKQQRLNKKQQKHKSKSQIKKIKRKKIVEQSYKQQQSQQQEQVLIKRQKKKKKKNKKVKQIIKQSSEQQQIQQQQQKQSQKYESQQQSSEQQLPRVIRTKKVLLKQKILNKQISKSSPIQQQIQSNHHQPSKHKQNQKHQPIQSGSNNQEEQQQSEKQQIKSNNLTKPQILKPILKQLQRPVNYSQRKKIIQADDIQSSDVSSEEQIKVKQHVNSKQNQPKMQPPALRNKFQKSTQLKPANNYIEPLVSKDSFKKHQQQQWILVTKQILQKHKQLLQNSTQQISFSQPNNLIKFKQIELDEQRFVPITSQWIEGTVENVQKDGKLKLIKVTQLGRQYRDRYQICEHNMVEFQINKNYLTKQQRQIVLGSQNGNVVAQVNVETIETKQIPSVLPVQQTQSRNSVQKFVCGQVNYYFGDKNYPFDLFMQMHANKNLQKYIPVRFLLNFPKIKKILKDENKLFQYLVEDEKRAQRNFEIDEQKKMVRKKIAKLQIEKQKENISQQKIIIEQQIITENN